MRKIFLVVWLWFVPMLSLEAAALYIDPPRSSLNQGDTAIMALRLNVEEAIGECMNAVDGVVHYSPELQLIDVSIGNSILPFWVETPVINEAAREVTFAGGIPNGYCGRVTGDPRLTNVVAELVFRAIPNAEVTESATAVVEFTEQSFVYANDGQGTRITPDLYPAEITIQPFFGDEIVDPWQQRVLEDTLPPEEFSIVLERGETEFRGRYFISFNTTDKQSGMSHYEVMEESLSNLNFFTFGAANAPWVRTRSPHELRDQSLNSIIRVKAVDKAGNEYIATLIPDASLRGFAVTPSVIILTVAGALMIGLMVVVIVLDRRRRKERKVHTVTESPNV